MKTNQDYKNAALSRIRGNWAPLIVATIVFVLIVLLCEGVSEWKFISEKLPKLAFFVPSTFGLKALLEGCGLVTIFFIAGPVSVGYDNSIRVFYETGDTNVTSNMFHITIGNYLHIVWAYFLMTVKIFLWTLLLIIPGVIKSYAYAMTPFILVEHPEMSAGEAMSESEKIMEATNSIFSGSSSVSSAGSFCLSLPWVSVSSGSNLTVRRLPLHSMKISRPSIRYQA